MPMNECYCFTMNGSKFECANCIDARQARAAKAIDAGNFRMFFGPVGDLLGVGSDGVPVTADEEGVEPMQEITDMVSSVSLDPPAEDED